MIIDHATRSQLSEHKDLLLCTNFLQELAWKFLLGIPRLWRFSNVPVLEKPTYEDLAAKGETKCQDKR